LAVINFWREKKRDLSHSEKDLLVAEKTGEFSSYIDLKLGPQTYFSAKSQSEGTLQLVPELRKMAMIIAGAEEEHEKE